MKRCPQCQFIHLDQDEFCELDGTLLITDETELPDEAAVGQPKNIRQQERRRIWLGIAGAVLLGAVLAIAYLAISGKFSREQNFETVGPQASPPPLTVSVATPSPTLAASPSPEKSMTVKERSPAPPAGNSRAVVSRGPVSTGDETSSTAKMWIRLTNGATVEADEVWRTKEGVWYRRNGVVTLVKSNRVRAIEKPSNSR